MKLRQTLLLMLLLIASLCMAQYPFTQKISSPDPLQTPVIYDMLGDSKGYLWLATDKGLIKFNSRTFQILPFNNTQLKSVGYINEDASGVIWCANFYKQIFYVDNDSLKLFEVKDEAYKKLNNILNISVTKQSIVVSSFNTILEIDKNSHKVIKQFDANKISNAGFQFSTKMKDIVYYYTNKNNIQNFYENSRKSLSTNGFIEVRLVSDNKKIVAIERGKRNRQAFVFDGNMIQALPNFNVPTDAYIYHLAVTGENEFWICTQNGAYLWDYATGKTELLFPNERVSDIVKDFQGDYWVSTLDNGLYKCPNLNCKKLSKIFSSNNENATKILQLPNKHFILGNTKGEIVEINNNKFIKRFQSSTNDEVEFLSYDEIKENIFSDGGLFNYKSGKSISGFDFGKTVSLDGLGNIIIASFNRCVVAKNDFINFDTTSVPSNTKLYQTVSTTYLSIQGKRIAKAKIIRNKRTNWVLSNANKLGFWAAYDDDLYYYNHYGKIEIIKDKNGKSIVATHLLQNNKNELFVSTTTNGLLVLDEKNNIIKHFTKATGLQSNCAKKTILTDNNIWLLTDESLEIINTTTDLVQDFFSSTGIEFLTVFDFAIDNNKVILATPLGVMSYTQKEQNIGERIKITQLIVKSNGLELKQNVILPFSSNSVKISLDAIHYKSPSKLFFYYRLIGVDSNWQINNASNNKINYNFLKPGNYFFEVYAADVNMIFRSATSNFSFTVAKPYWQTWWFISIIGIGILGIVYLLLKWWTLRFKKQQTIKERLLKSKLTAIRSQMNPHFLYNVLNTVQGLVFANKKNEAAEMLGNFSDLMRNTLQESDKVEVSLLNEIKSLNLYLELEKKRFDKDFNFQIIVDELIDLDETFLPPMLIQPFAENAIKHGLLHKEGIKKLSISIKQDKTKLFVHIDDNGIGRNQSTVINQNKKVKSTGFATKAIEERIDIFNQINKQQIELQIIDKEQGTLVMLSLPKK